MTIDVTLSHNDGLHTLPYCWASPAAKIDISFQQYSVIKDFLLPPGGYVYIKDSLMLSSCN